MLSLDFVEEQRLGVFGTNYKKQPFWPENNEITSKNDILHPYHHHIIACLKAQATSLKMSTVMSFYGTLHSLKASLELWPMTYEDLPWDEVIFSQ